MTLLELPSDDAVLAYLKSKGMMRAVAELNDILQDETKTGYGDPYPNKRCWTPKRVVDAQTYHKENESIAPKTTQEEQFLPARRSWTPKRVVDADTFRKENPDSIPSPSDDEFVDMTVSNHSFFLDDSAASDGLDGRFQSRRSKTASKFLSKTTHGTRLKNSLKRNIDDYTRISSPIEEDDITAASTRSTRSSGSHENATLTVYRTHERNLSDEIPLESFHCDSGHDAKYNDDILFSPTAGYDDGSGTALTRKTWKVKRVIDVETFQREEESRDNFKQQLDKFKKRDDKNPELPSALESIVSPRYVAKKATSSAAAAISSYASLLPAQSLRTVSNTSSNRVEESSFNKDMIKDQKPPIVEKTAPSLKERIGMFSKHPTQPPSFLSSKHMKKLVPVQKEEEFPVVSEAPKTRPPLAKPPLLPRKGNKQMTVKNTMKNGLAVRQPSIKDLLPPPSKSLDVKKEEEDKRKKLQRADSSRRGRLRRQKSALINQKSVKKKSVFVPVSSKPAEDLSTFQLPVFPKGSEEMKQIKDALRNSFMINMEDAGMNHFVEAFEQVMYSQGEVIIKQGDAGDYMYVVAYGSVISLVNGKKVSTTGKGKIFGELSLLYTCPRAATVVAEHPSTRLFRVDQKSFRFVMRNLTRESEKKKEKLLRGIPFLKHLGEEDIHRLSAVMTPCLFETGDYIVKFGEQGDSFYVIQNGKVRVTDIVVGNISYEDVNLEAGDYFGEGALISTEPRAASVVAMTKGTAFAIDRVTFQKVLGDFEDLVTKSQDRQKLEGIKIFRDSNLTSKNFDKLVSHLKDKEFEAETRIFKEDKRVANSLYLVRQGTVRITTMDGSRTEEIAAGGYFGQEQLLADAQGKNRLAKYTAIAGKDGCLCGVLTLKACRSVFNTERMEEGLHAGGSVYKRKKRTSMLDLDFERADLITERKLGEGEFAQVFLVSRTKKGVKHDYALKVPHLTRTADEREESLEAFRREVVTLQQLHHPFIVDLHRTFTKDDGSMDMMMEAIKGGELWNRIHREFCDGEWESGMTEHQAKFYAFCIADALAYIHREQFVFRDLKPENVLLDATGYPKLVDFGFAKYCSDTTYTFCGTPNYLAPEVVRNQGHGAAVDHWSLGVVIYEMVTGENPFYFEDMDQIALFESIVTEDYYPLPESSNPALQDFIAGLLEKDPVQRLGSLAGRESDILRHNWFDDIDLEMLRKKEIKAPWIPN